VLSTLGVSRDHHMSLVINLSSLVHRLFPDLSIRHVSFSHLWPGPCWLARWVPGTIKP